MSHQLLTREEAYDLLLTRGHADPVVMRLGDDHVVGYWAKTNDGAVDGVLGGPVLLATGSQAVVVLGRARTLEEAMAQAYRPSAAKTAAAKKDGDGDGG